MSSDYVNKSGVAALGGIGYTGRLDDDGLPELCWYGVPVTTLTVGRIITAALDAIGFADLDADEQSFMLQLLTEQIGGKPFQRAAVRRIVAKYRRDHQ